MGRGRRSGNGEQQIVRSVRGGEMRAENTKRRGGDDLEARQAQKLRVEQVSRGGDNFLRTFFWLQRYHVYVEDMSREKRAILLL